MITSTHGLLDEATCVRRNGTFDNDNETTLWVEYWLPRADVCTEPGHDVTDDWDGQYMERVHRSVHVTLKHWPGMETAVGGIG